MTQAASLTSPTFLLSSVLAASLGLAASPARAEEISSVYTSLDLKHCKDVTPKDIEDYGAVAVCPGYDGIDVRVAEGDLRIFVSYGPGAATQTAAYETVPQFNTIGDTLEWRGAKEGGRWTPFATILRFKWSIDGKTGSTLVVTKLGKNDTCHVAYVEASGNPQANEQARAIADREARTFRCRTDKAKTYGAHG
jgi:hypothetical protein